MQRRVAHAAAASSVALAHAQRPDSDLRERLLAEGAHQEAASVWLLEVADELPEGDTQRRASSVSDAHGAAKDFLSRWRMEESTPVHNTAQRALQAATVQELQATWPRLLDDVRRALAEATAAAPAVPPSSKVYETTEARPEKLGALLDEARRLGVLAFRAGHSDDYHDDAGFVAMLSVEGYSTATRKNTTSRTALLDTWLDGWTTEKKATEPVPVPRAPRG